MEWQWSKANQTFWLLKSFYDLFHCPVVITSYFITIWRSFIPKKISVHLASVNQLFLYSKVIFGLFFHYGMYQWRIQQSQKEISDIWGEWWKECIRKPWLKGWDILVAAGW